MTHPIRDPRTEALFNDRGAPVRYTMSTRLTRLEPVHPGEILHEDFMKPLGIRINRRVRDIVVSPGRIGATVI